MTYLGPETYDQEFAQRQFIEILRALEIRNEVQVPEDLAAPRQNDVSGDLRALTEKVNRILSTLRLQASARTPLLTMGDGGLGNMVEGLRDAVKRVGNIQGGKGLKVRNTPDGIMLIPTDTQNEYLLADDSGTITWIKLTTPVTSPEGGVPFADGNPVGNKDGDDQDTARTVRVYLPQIGGGTVYLESGDIVPVQSDLNGDYISQQVGPATLPAANIPIGGIIMWSDVDASGVPQNVPTGWNLCDGTNGTRDLRSQFLVGYDARTDSGYTDARDSNSGGSATIALDPHPVHNHGGTTVVYSHYGPYSIVLSPGVTAYLISKEDASHDHTINNQAVMTHSSKDNRPPWVVAVWIQRIA